MKRIAEWIDRQLDNQWTILVLTSGVAACLVYVAVTAWDESHVKSTAKEIVDRLNNPTIGTNLLYAKTASFEPKKYGISVSNGEPAFEPPGQEWFDEVTALCVQ